MKTWTHGRLQGALQLGAALCFVATPALAQLDGGVDVQGIETAPEEGAAETEPAEEMAPEEPAAETEPAEEGAMLPGGLDEMGTEQGPQAQNTIEGEVNAIDLEAGTVELDSESEGVVSLHGDTAQLQSLTPGQMVSVTFEDRGDARWISEVQPATESSEQATEPAMEENMDANEAESVQQPQGKRMNEGYGGTSAELSEEQKTEPAAEEMPAEKAEKAEKTEPAAEAGAETKAEKAQETADEAQETAERAAEKADAALEQETMPAEEKMQQEAEKQQTEAAEERPAQREPAAEPRQPRQPAQGQRTQAPAGTDAPGSERTQPAFESRQDPTRMGPQNLPAPAFRHSKSAQQLEQERIEAEAPGNRHIP